MRPRLNALLPALYLMILTGCTTPTTGPHKHQALLDEWIDPDTGHRVVRLSQVPGESQSFYFHNRPFTAGGDKLVFENRSTLGDRRFYTLDLHTRKIQRLTNQPGRGEILARKSRELFYQNGTQVWATRLDDRKTRLIATLPKGWNVATINADETMLAGSFSEERRKIAAGKPRSVWFNAIQAAHAEHALFTVTIATGQTNVFYHRNDWLNHLQFSPTDPTLLMFCHEGPWHLVDRIWNIRTDGSDLKLIHQRTLTNEIAGHEFWSPDGKRVWYDLQVPRGESFFLASKDITNGETLRYPLERNNWSVHYNISSDGKLFAGDGGKTNSVARAPDGKWIWLFTPQTNGTLHAEKLVNMAAHNYELEPNVHFSPDNKWIIFRGNMTGTPQVYAVEIEKTK